jgi:transcriptional regulator with XRE-family HTH domain
VQLLSQIRACKLAEIRRSQGETQVAVAQRMGVTQARVSAIEHGEVGRSEVDTLASYIEALGGKLKLVAAIRSWSLPERLSSASTQAQRSGLARA